MSFYASADLPDNMCFDVTQLLIYSKDDLRGCGHIIMVRSLDTFFKTVAT